MQLDRVYAATRARIGVVLTEAGAAADDVTVPSCPDWNVAQLVGHLAGTTVALVQRDYPSGDVQEWVDGHVAARAGRSALDNWREWDSAGPAFEQLLVASPARLGSLLYDAIIHEDDINAAIGRPSPQDPDAISYGLNRLFEHIDRDSRQHAIGTLTATIGDAVYIAGEGSPEVGITLTDRWEALRAFGSRRSLAQLTAMGFDGDIGPWIAVFAHDPPAVDLHEPR